MRTPEGFKPINIAGMSNLAWHALDLDRLGNVYIAIVFGGDRSTEALKRFCDAISFTAFHYEGHSMRVPNRFNDVAPELIAMCDQVLQRGGELVHDSENRNRLLGRIREHRDKITSVLEKSGMAGIKGSLFCEGVAAAQ
jgi:hypothetical protein